MLERDFQKQVIQLARLYKWKCAHFRPAMTKRGWVTPVAADGKGFPDLILVREKTIAVELKCGKNKLSADQDEWLHWFSQAGIETFCWTPEQWDGLESILTKPPPAGWKRWEKRIDETPPLPLS